MAEPDHLGARLPRHQGATLKDWIADLEQPGVRADPLHVPGDAQHQFQIEVGHPHAPVVALLLPGRPLRLLLPVRLRGGVEHEIGIAQGSFALQRRLDLEIDPEFGRVPPRQPRHRLQPPRIDVHERDEAARQRRRQTQIPHDPQRELRTPRPNHRNLHPPPIPRRHHRPLPIHRYLTHPALPLSPSKRQLCPPQRFSAVPLYIIPSSPPPPPRT